MRAIFGDPGFFENFFAPRVLPCCFSCFWVILTQKSDLNFFVRGVGAPKPTLLISRGFIKMVKEGTLTWTKIFDEKNFSYVSPLNLWGRFIGIFPCRKKCRFWVKTGHFSLKSAIFGPNRGFLRHGKMPITLLRKFNHRVEYHVKKIFRNFWKKLGFAASVFVSNGLKKKYISTLGRLYTCMSTEEGVDCI